MLTYMAWDVFIEMIRSSGNNDAIDYFIMLVLILCVVSLTPVFLIIDLFLIPIEIIAYLLAQRR